MIFQKNIICRPGKENERRICIWCRAVWLSEGQGKEYDCDRPGGGQDRKICKDFVEGKLSREQYLQEKAGIAEHLEELSAQIAVTKKTIEELSVKGT